MIILFLVLAAFAIFWYTFDFKMAIIAASFFTLCAMIYVSVTDDSKTSIQNTEKK